MAASTQNQCILPPFNFPYLRPISRKNQKICTDLRWPMLKAALFPCCMDIHGNARFSHTNFVFLNLTLINPDTSGTNTRKIPQSENYSIVPLLTPCNATDGVARKTEENNSVIPKWRLGVSSLFQKLARMGHGYWWAKGGNYIGTGLTIMLQ